MHQPTDRITHTTAFLTPFAGTRNSSMALKINASHYSLHQRPLKLEEFTVIDGVKWTSPPPSLQDDVDAVMKTIVDEPMDVDNEFVPEISYQCNVTNGYVCL